eukprot:5351117-Lingulodinium_polyedra.AAC.1
MSRARPAAHLAAANGLPNTGRRSSRPAASPEPLGRSRLSGRAPSQPPSPIHQVEELARPRKQFVRQ